MKPRFYAHGDLVEGTEADPLYWCSGCGIGRPLWCFMVGCRRSWSKEKGVHLNPDGLTIHFDKVEEHLDKFKKDKRRYKQHLKDETRRPAKAENICNSLAAQRLLLMESE